jgi:hypothetical protein
MCYDEAWQGPVRCGDIDYGWLRFASAGWLRSAGSSELRLD